MPSCVKGVLTYAPRSRAFAELYDLRIGGWLTWEQVQQARVASFAKLDEAQFGTSDEKRFALRDCAAMSLLSLIPPDRVGAIRRVRGPTPSHHSHQPTRAGDRALTIVLSAHGCVRLDRVCATVRASACLFRLARAHPR